MKNLIQLTSAIWLLGLAILPAHAAFSSLYVFGDTLSATADNPAPAPASNYYQKHDSNGRVWVEVLAQRQGLTLNATNNSSYYDHNSTDLLAEIVNFKAPQDVANDLFVVWVCNADTFDAANDSDDFAHWQIANTQSQVNHLAIIAALYARGVRTLIMPNAVDISEIPAFNIGTKTLTDAEHAGCIDYNLKFSNTISQARALWPSLTIYAPDYFTLLNNVLTNAAAYGLTNALYGGLSMDAIDLHYNNPNFPPAAMNGFGTNFIFWDSTDPTAKLHEIMADTLQQTISPVQISKLTAFNGSNRLDLVNIPVGLNGSVDGSTNLAAANWTSVTNITSSNATQSIFVSALPLPPAGGGSGGSGGGSIDPNNPGTNTVSNFTLVYNAQFYRLRFPYTWTWP